MDLSQFTHNGKFLMLALDHRESFKKLINPQNPDQVVDEKLIQLKSEIIGAVSDQFSSLLIDPYYGLQAYKNRTKPFLLCIERSGYKEFADGRYTELEFSGDEIKGYGAAGGKLLLYFNPYKGSAHTQLTKADDVRHELNEIYNLPLFLEIVTYGSESKQKLITESVQAFLRANVQPDVFKLEFPGDAENCKKITGMLGQTPWILLTGGEEFNNFKHQLEIATQNGCVGFLAGRALWKEIFELVGEEKQTFLRETLPQRFREISEIVLRS